MNQEDKIVFAQENVSPAQQQVEEAWKILIVDDEVDVHQVTHFALDDYIYQGKKLKMFSAFSAEQAKHYCQKHNDIAVILLDVVMETNNAGLMLADYIRNTLKNPFVRIILRTGQPGHAPEKEVILKYEINDYQNKTDLSKRKLFTVITASLRAYSDIMTIESLRAHLEEKVTERTAALIQLNQEKDEFLSIAAHDLKNPLSGIQGVAEVIISDFDTLSKEELIEFANMIRRATQQMFKLVTNLLDVSLIEAGKMSLSSKAIDILEIVQSLVLYYSEAAKAKHIILRIHSVDPAYWVYADNQALHQVLDNLISNAIKYSPHRRHVTLRLWQDNDKVCCEVQDEGLGLGLADQQKLFGKFARLTPRPTGGEHSTGLGLFIVKKLVDLMKGKVWCESVLHQGAKFIVEFPRESLSK